MKRIILAKHCCAFKLLVAWSESFNEVFLSGFFSVWVFWVCCFVWLGFFLLCGYLWYQNNKTKYPESIMSQNFFLYIISLSAALAAQISQEGGYIKNVPEACALHL